MSQDEKARDVLAGDIKSLNDRYISVQTSLNSGEAALLINSIKSEIRDKEKDKSNISEQLKQLKEHLERIKAALRYIPECKTADSEIVALEQSEMDMGCRNSIVIETEDTFAQAEQSFRGKLTDKTAELNALNKDIEQLAKEIKALEQNKPTYDKNITMLKEAIEREVSARGIVSEVHILADLLEISDIKWRESVEGYLNSQRFHVIVEPEYYDIAAEVYDRNKSKIHTAAVVNTAKRNTTSTKA